VEPSAVAARRTRASLALAVGGAIVLMAGVALILTGEAMRLEHPVHPRPLIVPGLVLVVLGFALGVSAAVTILLDAPTRLPSAHLSAEHAPGDPPPAGQAPDDLVRYAEAVPGEVLSSFRLPDPAYPGGRPEAAPPGPPAPTEVVPGAALPPPGRDAQAPPAGVPSARAPAAEMPPAGVSPAGVSPAAASAAGVPPAGVPAAREPLATAVPPSPWFRPGQPGPDQPSGEPPGYSDAGWEAAAASSSWPDPPAEPPHEIHHPVRR
jgi:hypothetical protein